jgi:hypothetical protein
MRFYAGRWSVHGNADEVRKSDERRKVVTALQGSCDKQIPTGIPELTGMKVQTVRVLLRKMLVSGDVIQPRVRFYTPAHAKPQPS